MKKAQIQFGWIFAVIIGAFVLFLAFYFIGTNLLSQRHEQETVETRSLEILMNPFAYFGSFVKATYNPLTLQKESQVMLRCEKGEIGSLGYDTITLIQKKGSSGAIPKKVYDKYIFSPQPLKAKKFDALSKPLKMPWRVADIIILWPSNQKYCFVNAPIRIKDEISNESTTGLGIPSIFFKETSGCPDNSIIVCFSGGISSISNCNIIVDTSSKEVKKNIRTGTSKIYYSGDALMYAAIFSDPKLYACNVQRLASRINLETEVYEEKASTLLSRGCTTSYDLNSLKKASGNVFTNPTKENIQELESAANALNNVNNMASCKLF